MEANVNITAQVRNSHGDHRVTLATDGVTHAINIPPRDSGFGSSVNGGELLFLALATCYCNDIYREAAKRGITVESVDVTVDGQFGAAGEPAQGISYRAKVIAQATESEIQELMRHTDTVSEIQNTLRAQIPVTLSHIEAVGQS
jgi:organic hydroperoxide reductase OsmC/OhrA